VRRFGVRVSQSGGQSLAAVSVGWQWRLVVSTPFTSRWFCLAQGAGRRFCYQSGAMGLAGNRRGLAAFIGDAPSTLAGLIFHLKNREQSEINPVNIRLSGEIPGIISPMKLLAELDHLDLDPTAKSQVAALIQSLLDQAERDAALLQSKDAIIKAKDFKIEALMHEVAYYRRIRFSVKSETLSPLQRDVFEETWNTDVYLNSSKTMNPARRLLNLNAHAQVDNPCRRICRASNTIMNPSHALVGNAAKTWSESVKTSPNNWMSNLLSLLSIVTFALNMHAKTAKPSPPHRFHLL